MTDERKISWFDPTVTAETKRVGESIASMGNAALIDLQRELQFALTYHQEASRQIQATMTGSLPEYEKSRLCTLAERHEELVGSIPFSPLYQEIRRSIAKNGWGPFPPKWIGWLGLRSSLEVQEITLLTRTIIATDRELRPFGCLSPTSTGENRPDGAARAEETLRSKYGIRQTFLVAQKPTDLVSIFLENWGN